MNFDELKLLPGLRIKLVVANAAASNSLACQYIGSFAPHTLLVATPAGIPAANLRAGAKVAVSLASPTGIVTFSSSIRAIALEPYPLMHLEYPTTLQVRNVRSAVRVGVEVLAQVTNLYADDHLEMYPARILDMSVGGMKLGAAASLGDIGDELAVHVRLSVDDIAREILLTGTIRTSSATQNRADGNVNTYGIEFTQLDEDKRVLLYAFVFNMVQRCGPQI